MLVIALQLLLSLILRKTIEEIGAPPKICLPGILFTNKIKETIYRCVGERKSIQVY